ncbi:MAG: ribonuclease P protein component [Aeoliella sp.]
MTQSFPKSRRLLTKAEFDRVFAVRKSRSDRQLVVYSMVNELGHPRLGLVVSRKVGNAVIRNRWKRLLREAFRLVQEELPAVDLVCLPRPNAKPELAALKESLRNLATTE